MLIAVRKSAISKIEVNERICRKYSLWFIAIVRDMFNRQWNDNIKGDIMFRWSLIHPERVSIERVGRWLRVVKVLMELYEDYQEPKGNELDELQRQAKEILNNYHGNEDQFDMNI